MLYRSLRLVACASLLFGCGGGGGGSGSGGSGVNPLVNSSMVGHWNHVAIDTSGLDHSAAGAKENLGPTKSSRAMAIVHIAIHDAIQAIQQKYETYLPQEAAPAGASVDAAVAQAAHDTLTALYPSQTAEFEGQLTEDLAKIEDGDSKDQGIEAGRKAAQLILADRANDGASALDQSTPYTFIEDPGHWSIDPFNPQQKPVGQNWYRVRPFVMKSATQFRSTPPPSIESPEYAEAFAEVFRLGGDGVTTPTERTQEQTEIGLYWAYDGTPSLCAPPRLYNQIAMQLAADQNITDAGELARLLVLVNVAMSDAGIASWDTKYHYSFWRPVTAIQQADAETSPTGKGDGNDLTTGDPNWKPLGAPASNLSGDDFTPPFPAYVSGHATFGGALFEVLRNFFHKDDVPFTFVSDELNGETKDVKGNVRNLVPRSFSSFSQAEEENGQSRIYLGIHWSFDKVEGIRMGNQVADWVMDHAFQPK